VSISSFVLAIGFAHFISKEAYGQYKYIISIAALLGTFSLTGFSSAVLRSVASGYEGTLRYAFYKNLRWSTFFFVISYTISVYYFVNGNSSLGISMLIVGSLWPFFQSTNLYNAYLISKKDFKRNALYFEIIGNLFPVICLLITMSVTSNPVWLVTTYFGSNTIIGLILYKRVIDIYKPSGEVDPGAMGYTKHLSFMNILSGIANNIDQILVFQFIGAAELAIYNFAIAIPNQAKGPLKGLSNMMLPKFVERNEKEIQANMRHKYLIMFVTGLILAIGYIILAPYIFHAFFPKYSDSIIYSQIFAISFLAITFNPADIYFAAKRKIKEQYITTVFGSVIQIVTISIAIIYWGLLGLIIARVLVRLFMSWISAILYQYSTRKISSDE
jgi:O-antigen/teichoic acid export membrane protein